MAMTNSINDKEMIEYLLQADPVLGAKGETMRCKHDFNLQEAHRLTEKLKHEQIQGS